MEAKEPSVGSLNRANADEVERSPAEINQRAHILERLKNLKRVLREQGLLAGPRGGGDRHLRWLPNRQRTGQNTAVAAPRGRAGDAGRRLYALGRPRDRRAGRLG